MVELRYLIIFSADNKSKLGDDSVNYVYRL